MKWVLFLFGLAIASSNSFAGPVEKRSLNSVKVTVDKLQKVVSSKGFKIIARVDHAAAAKKVGLDLRPTELLIFGNPAVGTQLMLSNQRIGLDLPVRIVVFENRDGSTVISYHPPAEIAADHQVTDKVATVRNMSKALDKLTTLAASK